MIDHSEKWGNNILAATYSGTRMVIEMRGRHDNFDAYNHFYCSKIGKKKLCFYSSIVQYGPSTQSTMNFFLS